MVTDSLELFYYYYYYYFSKSDIKKKKLTLDSLTLNEIKQARYGLKTHNIIINHN